MSWAKLKKTSLDHVRQTSREEANAVVVEGEGGPKVVAEAEAAGNNNNNAEEAKDEFPDDVSADLAQKIKTFERSTSWANLQRKITPVARRLSKETSSERDWIVEERLKVNFYLDDGVSKWHIVHPVANGPRQSPIDIRPGEARLDPGLRPINVDYAPGCVKSVVNTGNSFKVDVDDAKATMIGGALENEFKLIQFHAHWGTTAGAKGSEHTVDGKLYDAELHLVHWNSKYGLFSKAVEQPDGLAVIGIFLQVTETSHPEFEKVIDLFESIQYRNMKANYDPKIDIDPAKFLPDDLSYWFYPGSLTTPPLAESVLWHVLRTPIQISKSQLYAMASLRTGTSREDCVSCIINNFRPPVPLGNRKVKLFTGERAASAVANGEDATSGEAVASEKLLKEVSDIKTTVSQLREEVSQLKMALNDNKP